MRILALLLCLGATQFSMAQFIPIAASTLNVEGQPIASGKVLFTPVDVNGQPITLCRVAADWVPHVSLLRRGFTDHHTTVCPSSRQLHSR
jgi:hypothetical protein